MEPKENWGTLPKISKEIYVEGVKNRNKDENSMESNDRTS